MKVEGRIRPVHVIYNKNTKTIEEATYSESQNFKVGDQVMFRFLGRKTFGEIVAVVRPGESAHSVAVKNKLNVNYGFLVRTTPRGQYSYLVLSRGGMKDQLFWPEVSDLRKVEK